MSNFLKLVNGRPQGTAMALTDLPSIATGTVLGNISDSSSTPTAVTATASATASTLMFRDVNGNVQVNSLAENITTTATAAGTTTLTVASTYNQQFTGTTTQTVVLPNATTLVNGQAYAILNRSTGVVTVNANGGGLIQSVAANNQVIVTLVNNSTSAGVWDAAYSVSSSSGGGGFTNPMTSVGDMIVGGTAGAAQRLGIGSTGQILSVSGGTPTWSYPTSTTTIPPQVTTYTSGSGTYTVPSGASYIVVQMVGGGGGGGSDGNGTPTSATAGSNTTFGANTANGGSAGINANIGSGGAGGTTSSISLGTGISLPGGGGGAAAVETSSTSVQGAGGTGGNSIFGGGGAVSLSATSGSGGTNTGGGGAGGSQFNSNGNSAGGGGGAGGACVFTITSLATSYSYSVGAGGTGAGSGGRCYAGGAGGSGVIIVTAYFSAGQAIAVSGTSSVSSGTTSATINFSNPLSSASYQLFASFTNSTDSNPEFQPITITSKTSTGFTAKWNSPLLTSNYSIDYYVAGINTTSVVVNNIGKNYLSPLTTSNGVNGGNNNFESGSVSGWSLANTVLSSAIPTSTATAGSAFSSSSGGTSASGNLTFSLISSGQICGSYSASLASSAASTAGDMLISNAFYIDTEDQAKMMTVRIYYKAVSGTFNFSGTSSNSFAVWIYDVTNGAWIMPAGVYNLTQGTGVGYCTATFQTTSNSTQYQLALININATSGAYSLYVDDFYVGPQTAPMGPAMTDWNNNLAFTYSGLGTVSTNNVWTKRVGDTLQVWGSFTAGTTTSSTFQINLPLSIDYTKLPSVPSVLGTIERAPSSSSQFAGSSTGPYVLFCDGSTNNAVFLGQSAASQALIKSAGNNFNSGDVGYFSFSFPVAGYSSNVSMSSDTDTRVVAASAHVSSGVSTASTSPINFNVVDFDSHGAITTGVGTWKYTVPVTGDYLVTVNYFFGSTGTNINVYKNGSLYRCLGGTTGSAQGGGSTLVPCNAGDTLAFYPGATATPTANSGSVAVANTVTINRLSGPAVVAATEIVSMIYNGQPANVSANAAIIFPTKQQDTHNAYNTSTGIYTVPVSGTYVVTGVFYATGTNQGALYIYKNGSPYVLAGGVQSASITTGAGNVLCNAGDQISLNPGQALSSFNSTTYFNQLSIYRLKN